MKLQVAPLPLRERTNVSVAFGVDVHESQGFRIGYRRNDQLSGILKGYRTLIEQMIDSRS